MEWLFSYTYFFCSMLQFCHAVLQRRKGRLIVRLKFFRLNRRITTSRFPSGFGFGSPTFFRFTRALYGFTNRLQLTVRYDQEANRQVGRAWRHDMDGHIYAVHDQIESRGLWYNSDIFEKAGITEEAFADWDSFGEAMEKIRALDEDVYGYIAGQGSSYIVNTVMASTDEGKKMLESELTEDTINSEEFAAAFKTAANLDQANGSEHTTDDNGNLMAEFNTNGKAGVLFNGVWNASGIDASLTDAIEPALFPGNIAIASAGGGLAVANNMSDEKTELALEFIKYMTSAEVQEKIFTGVQANPCNTTVDLNALAEESDDAATRKLAQACSQVNEADTVVIDMNYTWGSDVDKAIINALMECAVSGTDIDARFAALQTELIALVA